MLLIQGVGVHGDASAPQVDALALMNAQEWDSAPLVGPSMGGLVALPEVLAGMSLADVDTLAVLLAPELGHAPADQPPVAMRQFAAMGSYDAQPHLGAPADLPTLVVSAEHDPIAPPRLGRSLAAAVPGARYVELDGASHGVPVLDPPRIDALLLAHLADA